MILSVSRRTDIPGYYSEWFMNRIKEGYVLTKNPMNPNQISRVLLEPDLVDCIVFWTKDPQNMIDKLPMLDQMGYSYYFQFTLTPYGKDMERNLRDKDEIIKTFQKLSTMIGNSKLLWRYDPIVINDTLTEEYHLNNFKQLCGMLQGYTTICTISFVDIYSKLNKQIKMNRIREIPEEVMHRMASALAKIADSYGMELRACCEMTDLTLDGVLPAACIDKKIIERVCGHGITVKRDKNQRIGCSCVQSVDIGVYNTCRNGCIYCYANHSDESINRNCQMHNPYSDILIGKIADTAVITERIK